MSKELLSEDPVAELTRLRAENERMRKLYHLAAHDVIFFSGYCEEVDDWPEVGEYYCPVVNLNDTFAYACADGERVEDSEIDNLLRLWKQYGYDGVVAWAAKRRGTEPIPPRVTAKYLEARKSI